MAQISTLNDIKKGLTITWDKEPYVILEANFVRMQQRKPVMQTKFKSLLSGKVIEYSFKPGDKVEVADLSRSKANYLYKDETFAYFMDNQSFEQFSINLDKIGAKVKFLKDDTDCEVLYFEGNPVNVDLPIKMNLKVISAPPGEKGNSASNVTKPVTLETGAVINAPMFIDEGESITINTETEEYVSRAN